MNDCNNCTHHIQAEALSKQPAICWTCTGVHPGKLANWKPMSKSYDAAFRTDDKQVGLAPTQAAGQHPVLPAKQAVFSKTTSNGSTASYYELPQGARELQDLISHKDMNAQMGEIFRAVYRFGEVSHSPKIRDIKKIIFYANEELKRLEKLPS